MANPTQRDHRAAAGVAAHARAAPDAIAVIDGHRTRTYAELDERSTRLARAYIGLGGELGGSLAVMLENSIETFECMGAAAKVAGAYLPVNWHLRAEELEWILADSGAPVLVADARFRDVAEAALAGARGCRLLLVGDGYEDALAGSDEPFPDQAPTHRWVIYTSGTTGRPKGVVHAAHPGADVAASQRMLVELWGYRSDDVHITSGPLYHTGPAGYATTTLFAGGTVVCLRWFEALEWMRLVEEHGVTTSFVAPAHFIRLLEIIDATRALAPDGPRPDAPPPSPPSRPSLPSLASLRHLIHAGAPCPPSVKRRIMDVLPDTEIWELYGASEGGATRIGPDEWRAHPGSVGRPWPGTTVRIVDLETGAALGPGETGAIWISPPGASRFHYHNDPDKTAAAWAQGDAFSVGDVGHLDADGYLYVTDRVSDMVIRAGANVYPREIEDVLHGHEAVVDCAVFGIPDDRDGEHLKAVVELRPSARARTTTDDLAAFCREHLASYKCPEVWELVEVLPRDPNGKVLKRFLRQQHWEGRDRAV
jgi:long-chain acyl-CoA synthetase